MSLPHQQEQAVIRQRAQQRQARQNAVACGQNAHQRRRQFDVRRRHEQADSGPTVQFEVGSESSANFRGRRVVDCDLLVARAAPAAESLARIAGAQRSTEFPRRRIARRGRWPRGRRGAPMRPAKRATAGRSSTQFSAPKFEIAPSNVRPIRPSSSALHTRGGNTPLARHLHHGGGGVGGIHRDAARREMSAHPRRCRSRYRESARLPGRADPSRARRDRAGRGRSAVLVQSAS